MSQEVFFKESDIIVSKTDLKGKIIYANDIFCDIAGYKETEVAGQPHSLLRHPDMPRCVFQLLWEKLPRGEEVFVYVVNQCKNGDYYWVFAHITPSFDTKGNIVAYHSNRRVPNKKVVQENIVPLYKALVEIETSYTNKKEGQAASFAHLAKVLADANTTYEEFVFSLRANANQEKR